MKLSFSAFFLVLAGCSKTAANAANNTATAAIVELAVASTKVKKTKDKTNDKDPSANVVVAAAAFEATITTSNFVPPTCSPDEILIEVDLYTDYTPQENWWTVTKNIKYRGEEYTSMTPVLTGGPYLDDDSQDVTLIQDAVCVPKEEQYSVTIYDKIYNGLQYTGEEYVDPGYFLFKEPGGVITYFNFNTNGFLSYFGFTRSESSSGDITVVPTDPCPVCPQSKAGKRTKAGSGSSCGIKTLTCSPTERLIEVDLFTDKFPEETVWTVHRNIEHEGEMYSSIVPVLTGGPYFSNYDENSGEELIHVTKCVPEGQYTFTIYDSFDDGISSANNGYGYYSFKYDGIVVRNDNFTEMIATETLGTFVDCPTCPAKKRSTTIQSSLMKSDGKYSSPLTGSTLTLIAALSAYYLFVTF